MRSKWGMEWIALEKSGKEEWNGLRRRLKLWLDG